MTLWTFFCEWTQQGEMSLLKSRYLPAILYDFSVDEKFPHINWDSPRLCNWCPPKLLEFIKPVLSKSNNHLNIFFPKVSPMLVCFIYQYFLGKQDYQIILLISNSRHHLDCTVSPCFRNFHMIPTRGSNLVHLNHHRQPLQGKYSTANLKSGIKYLTPMSLLNK